MRERVLDGRGTRVGAEPCLIGRAQGAELDAEEICIARYRAQRLGDQQLVVAHPVEVARVEQVDPGIERGADRRDALGAVGGTIHPGHAHAAEADNRDLRTGLAKSTPVHRAPF